MKKTRVLILLVFLASGLFAQAPAIKTAKDYLAEKGEVYFRFEITRDFKNTQVLNLISIDRLEDNTVYAYANAEAFERFLGLGLYYEVLEHPGDAQAELNMKTWDEILTKDLTDSWDFYPTYPAYVSLMHSFGENFPELCKIYNIGQTVNGRSLLFARVSAGINQNNKPRFMYTSTIHGDETTGFILSLRLIHYLLTSYGQNPEITDLLENAEIWICPNENPDGTYTNDDNTISGATRFNANAIDLNRNYPNPAGTPQTPIQPETQAMISFIDTMGFVMSANMHGGTELVNFPFDSWTSFNPANLHADHNWWYFVSREYADTAQYYSPQGYMTARDNGVTHGGDWYVVYGSRQDYVTYYAHGRELTLELSNTKMLPASLLPAHWEYNYPSLLNYIRQSTYGIRGTVSDALTGQPLVARIEVLNHDKNNSEVYSRLPSGSFFRPILAGNYNLKITAENYLPKEITGIQIENYQQVILNVALEPDPNVSVTLPTNEWPISAMLFPNPVQNNSLLKVFLKEPGFVTIKVQNLAGQLVFNIFEGMLDAGENYIELSGLNTINKSGIYLLQINHPRGGITKKATIIR